MPKWKIVSVGKPSIVPSRRQTALLLQAKDIQSVAGIRWTDIPVAVFAHSIRGRADLLQLGRLSLVNAEGLHRIRIRSGIRIDDFEWIPADK